MTEPVFQEPQPPKPQAPKPGPRPQAPQPVTETEPQTDPSSPPWGDDFDPQKAWGTIKKLRDIEKRHEKELQQAQSDREELEKLRNEMLTADQRALQEATTKATDEARAAVQKDLLPKVQQAQLKGIAAQFISDKEQLDSFLAITDPAKFAGEDGDVDETAVAGHLTALFAGRQKQAAPRQWGQYSAAGQPPKRPGDDARVALEKRHNVKNSS
jgi:hypothetical protein